MGESREKLFRKLLDREWTGFRKGIEKEGLRVDRHGFIAQTPHPRTLGSTLTHPRITTDYSESLLELITPVCETTEDVLRSLRDVHAYVQAHLGDEVLWSASMPCRLDGDESIPIAHYGSSNSGQLKEVYRRGLAVRYGRMMQSIAGAHYNFSLPEAFWTQWQSLLGSTKPLQDFKSDQYFWLIRNFRRRSWLLMWLFGASPALDASFVAGRSHHLRRFSECTLFDETATSLRMGDLGYHNNAQASLDICFNELKTYTDTLYRAIHTPWPPYEKIGVKDGQGRFIQINTNVLQIENEYYSAIRPKRTVARGEKPIQALQQRGVEYVEVRCLDLDPFEPLGMSAAQIDFLDLFLLGCLLAEGDFIADDECERLDGGYRDVVARGRERGLSICFNNEQTPVTEAAEAIMVSLEPLAEALDEQAGGQQYRDALSKQREKVRDPAQVTSARVLAAMQHENAGHLDWTLQQSLRHQNQLREEGLSPSVAESMEEAARNSILEQRELEAADTQSFEDYLAAYQAS